MMKPLVDGHGRPIGDVRVSVTDRCNFRCQYCMPAEGLPWLQPRRAAHLRGDRAARAAAERDGRPRRAPDRRRAARAPRAVAAGRDAVGDRGRPRPLADHQRLPARAPGRRPRARGPASASTSRSTRSRPTASSSSRAATRSPQVLDGLAAAQRAPRAAADQGQRRRAARLHRGRGRALRRVRAHRSPTRCASSSSCRSTPTARGAATRCCPTRRCGAMIDAVYPLEAVGRERHGTVAALALRRRPGRDRLHLPRHRAVLRRLQPHPPDRRGRAAHLPVLDDTRPTCARRCARARATPSSRRSSATPSGARSSSTTSATPGFVQPARSMSRIGG